MSDIKKFSEYITLEYFKRAVLVRFDKKDKLNTLSAQAMRELRDVARYLHDDIESTVIILCGNDNGFSGGADLKDPEMNEWFEQGLLSWRHHLRLGPDMCDAWEALEQVTICAIEGFCVGGGFALAVALDFRVASEDSYFILPEVSLGMNMSWHSNPRLVSMVGAARAKQIIILGERISAAQGLDWGFVEKVVSKGTSLDVSLDFASKFAALPPLPVRMTKQSINMTAKALHQTATYMDRDQFALTATSKDQKEAISAFLGKRKAFFTGD